MKHAYFLPLLLLIALFNGTAAVEWTWLHRKIFSEQEMANNKVKKNIVYTKSDLPNFTQLIFSWNAARSARGYLTFSAQVRDAQTKKWTPWYKMMEWGSGVQRSFKSDVCKGIGYIHVRLETGKRRADAFRIKVEPREGASLSSVYNCSVAISDFTSFVLKMRNFIICRQ